MRFTPVFGTHDDRALSRLNKNSSPSPALRWDQAADPDRPLTPSEWGVLEDDKPPLSARDDDVVPGRAREKIHAMFDRKDAKRNGRNWDSTSGESGSHGAGTDASLEAADPEVSEEQPARRGRVGRVGKTQYWDAQLDGSENVELTDLFNDDILQSKTPGLSGKGSFEIEYKRRDSDEWKEDDHLDVSRLDEATSETETIAGRSNGRDGAGDVTPLDDISFELEKNVGDGELDGGEPTDDDVSQQSAELETHQRQEPRVNWALPRRPRKSKPAPPPPPPSLEPPIAPEPAKAKSPGRPKSNVAKANSVTANGVKATRTNASGAKASRPRAKTVVNGAQTKSRVNGAQAKPPEKRAAAAAAVATPTKRGRGRPRTRARQEVVLRDEDDAD